jgi:uncharacterized protein YdbL (DUF1318 family)
MIERIVTALALAAIASGCANLVQVKIDVVDQRTALENQALGGYERIEGETLLLASVRSVDARGNVTAAPDLPEGKRLALQAMQRSAFNKDDIDRFKAIGAIGEGNDGYLVFFSSVPFDDAKQKAFARALTERENDDRRVLHDRIAATTEGFETGDAVTVAAVMAGLRRDAARPGDLIQNESGSWIVKKEIR